MLNDYQKKAGSKTKGDFGQGAGFVAVHKLVHMLLYIKNRLSWFFRISHQMSMNICLLLPILILSVDSDWLISTKVHQTLTGNMILFYSIKLWQSPSKWCLHCQSFPIKVNQNDLVKVWLKWFWKCEPSIKKIRMRRCFGCSKLKNRRQVKSMNQTACALIVHPYHPVKIDTKLYVS